MEPKDIFEEVKPQFTKQEQDLINLLFEISEVLRFIHEKCI